jgi:glucokinase
MILAGDIGGTKTRIALYESGGERLVRVVEETYASAEHASLEAILGVFRAAHPDRFDGAAFGVAGPVRDGRSVVTNLDWVVDARALARELGLAAVDVVNDLVATAHGIEEIAPEDLVTLQEGTPDPRGNRAVIAAGTGLGQAVLFSNGRETTPSGSESGHGDFAPANALEDDLVRFLRPEFEHVSIERVVSGPGLHNVYRFLRDTGRGEEPEALKKQIEEGDPSAAISRAALEGRAQLAEDALAMFVSAYGAQAGNFALAVLATGGVYVGGGIAPKILPKLSDGAFVRAFRAKSKLSELLAAIPIRVVLDDRAALLGAARCASLARHAR